MGCSDSTGFAAAPQLHWQLVGEPGIGIREWGMGNGES